MATKSKFNAKLKAMDKGWKSSKQTYKDTFAGVDIPDDVYTAKLQEAELTETASGKLRIRREHVIMEGEHKGVVVKDGLNLEGEYGPVFCRRWLAMLDLDAPEDAQDLEDLLIALKEDAPVCKIRVRHAGEFVNIDVTAVVKDDDDSSTDDDSNNDVDLDALDKSELREIVKENSLDIDKWRKMDEDTLREAIRELMEDDTDSDNTESDSTESDSTDPDNKDPDDDDDDDDDEVDLTTLDKPELLALINENEIDPKDLGFKNRLLMKKASGDKLRTALESYMAEESYGDASDDDDDLLEQTKVFCGTWDVKIAEDATLDDCKKAMAGCKFPEKELDDDEVLLLETLEMTECIQKPVAKKVKKIKKLKK
jgi:hypothetical protein